MTLFQRALLAAGLYLSAALLSCPPAHAAGPFTGEQVQAQSLPNGMRLIVREDHALPLVALDLWVKTGSASDLSSAPGAAHALEHMLFKGTAKRPNGVDTEMENLGASLEASTLKDGLHLYCTVASRYFPQALEILADVAQNAALPEEGFNREKGVILDELQVARLDPFRSLTESLHEQAYGDHPYGRTITGTVENVVNLSRQQIADTYKRAFVGGNMTLAVVGDVERDAAAQAVKTAFNLLTSGPVKPAPLPPVSWQERGGPAKELRIPGDKAYVLVGYPGPAFGEADAVVRMDLLYAALGLGTNSRLRQALIGRGLAERIQVDFLTQRGPGLFVIAAQCPPGKAARVREVIEEELEALRQSPLSAGELASAKNRLLSSYAFQVETYAGQASILGFYGSLGDWQAADGYSRAVSGATAAGVLAAAKKYLLPSQAIHLLALPEAPSTPQSKPGKPVITPLPESDESPSLPLQQPKRSSSAPREERIVPIPGSKRTFRAASRVLCATSEGESVQKEGEDAPLPIAAQVAGDAPPVAGKHQKEPQVRSYHHPSGLKVLVQPVAGQQIVSARLFVRLGASHEAKVPAGSAALLARMLVSEAAHPAIKEQLAFLSDQVGGGLYVEPGEDATVFSVLTTKDRLHSALDLLAYIVTQPILRDADIALQLAGMRSDSGQPLDPFTLGMNAFLNRLYPESRLGLQVDGHPDTLKAATRQQLEKLWSENYRLGNMILVLAGDVEPKAASDRADLAFKKKVTPGMAAEPAVIVPVHPPVTDEGVFERNVRVGVAVAGVRAPGALDADYPALSVLSAVLGGGKGSRLFKALREENGIGYDLGSWSPPRARNGYLAAYVLASPYHVSPFGAPRPVMETARGILLKELRSLGEGITDEELNRAKRYVIGTYALRHQRLADVSYLLGWWEAIGAGYRKDKEFPLDVEKVSKEDVTRLAKRLLGEVATITLLPDGSEDRTAKESADSLSK